MSYREKVIPVFRSIDRPIVIMRPEDVVLKPHADYPDIKTFHCASLSADLQASTCKANHLAEVGPMACKGCAVGRMHAAGKVRKVYSRHAAIEASYGLACIRCERSGSTATKFIGRFKLVRKHSLCVSCFNREREVEKGANSKGATPVKHSGLRPATITIEIDGKRETLGIGMRSGYLECSRYVERIHPGATLIETAIDGEIIPQFSLWTPLPFSPWAPKAQPKLKLVKPKALRAANDREAAETEDKPLRPRKSWLPPMTPEQAAEYEASFEDDEPIITAPADAVEPPCADESIPLQSDDDILVLDAWPALEVNPELGLAPFINWLTEDWPEPRASDAMAAQVADIEGQRFGRLLATGFLGTGVGRNAMWRFACDCGGNVDTRAADVKDGSTQSCGCLYREAARKRAAPSEGVSATEADADLTWAGKTLAHWSNSTGMSVDVLAANMVRTGSPFVDTQARIRPAPSHSQPVAPPEPVADVNARPEIIVPVVQAVAQPQPSKKWLAKQAARREREVRKAAAEQKRAIPLPATRAMQGAIAARGAALVAQFLNYKLALTEPKRTA